MAKDSAALNKMLAEGLSFEDLVGEMKYFLDGVTSSWHVPGLDRDDLRQEATIALWHCYERYDPNRGAKFLTMATLVVRNRMIRTLKRGINLNHPISEVVCDGCGFTKPKTSVKGGTCGLCGERKWTSVRNAKGTSSMDVILERMEDGRGRVDYKAILDPDMDTEGAALDLIEYSESVRRIAGLQLQ